MELAYIRSFRITTRRFADVLDTYEFGISSSICLCQETNRLDRPEWIFQFMERTLSANLPFLVNFVQGFFDRLHSETL